MRTGFGDLGLTSKKDFIVGLLKNCPEILMTLYENLPQCFTHPVVDFLILLFHKTLLPNSEVDKQVAHYIKTRHVLINSPYFAYAIDTLDRHNLLTVEVLLLMDALSHIGQRDDFLCFMIAKLDETHRSDISAAQLKNLLHFSVIQEWLLIASFLEPMPYELRTLHQHYLLLLDNKIDLSCLNLIKVILYQLQIQHTLTIDNVDCLFNAVRIKIADEATSTATLTLYLELFFNRIRQFQYGGIDATCQQQLMRFYDATMYLFSQGVKLSALGEMNPDARKILLQTWQDRLLKEKGNYLCSIFADMQWDVDPLFFCLKRLSTLSEMNTLEIIFCIMNMHNDFYPEVVYAFIAKLDNALCEFDEQRSIISPDAWLEEQKQNLLNFKYPGLSKRLQAQDANDYATLQHLCGNGISITKFAAEDEVFQDAILINSVGVFRLIDQFNFTWEDLRCHYHCAGEKDFIMLLTNTTDKKIQENAQRKISEAKAKVVTSSLIRSASPNTPGFFQPSPPHAAANQGNDFPSEPASPK